MGNLHIQRNSCMYVSVSLYSSVCDNTKDTDINERLQFVFQGHSRIFHHPFTLMNGCFFSTLLPTLRSDKTKFILPHCHGYKEPTGIQSNLLSYNNLKLNNLYEKKQNRNNRRNPLPNHYYQREIWTVISFTCVSSKN